MTVTDFAGILGLVAATALAAWMLLGANTTPHRGDPRHSASNPEGRPARHRATSGGRLHRIFR
jgi:hypothetical protein